MINANSLTELLAALSSAQDDVPERGLGRLKEHTEPWVMKRIVASLVSSGFLLLPISVKMGDRPDIYIQSSGEDCGVELMELVPPAYAHAVAIRNKEYPGKIVDRSVFGWSKHWTSSEIRDYLEREGHRLSGYPFMGNSVEREWVESLKHAIDKKTERLNSPGFRVHSENWIGTYSSSPGPAFNVDVAKNLLGSFDLARPQYALNFSAAINLVGEKIIVITKNVVEVYEQVFAGRTEA